MYVSLEFYVTFPAYWSWCRGQIHFMCKTSNSLFCGKSNLLNVFCFVLCFCFGMQWHCIVNFVKQILILCISSQFSVKQYCYVIMSSNNKLTGPHALSGHKSSKLQNNFWRFSCCLNFPSPLEPQSVNKRNIWPARKFSLCQ